MLSGTAMCFWIKHKINPARMIIGKKSFIAPTGLDLSGDERIKRIFRDRKLLHEHTVPPFAIYIDESTWNKFLQKANEEYALRNNEASGIILGNYLKDDFGEYIVGTHFEAGNGSGTSSVFCEISVHDQVRIIQSAKEKKLLQVIWIHSHPSFGAFYSTVDYRTLKSMYYAPHQAGIVVDNVKGESLGFKVRYNKAFEFKDIYLVKLDDDASLISRPFGKNPAKIFYANNRSYFTLNKKVNDPVSLKSIGKEIKRGDSEDVLDRISKAVDEIKFILSNSGDKNDQMCPSRQNWEANIKEIESLLNERYGEKPYKDVAPWFKIISEMRYFLNDGYSPASQPKHQDKLNELLNGLSKL